MPRQSRRDVCCYSDGYLRRVAYILVVWVALLCVIYVLGVEAGGNAIIPAQALYIAILIICALAIVALIKFANDTNRYEDADYRTIHYNRL